MSVGNFAVLALVDAAQATTMLWPMDLFRNQVRVHPHLTPIGSHIKC